MDAALQSPSFLSEAEFAERVRLSPLVSVDVVMRDGAGRALLAQRNDEPARGALFLPGGCILKNEPIETAFARIVLRETGCRLDFTAARFLGVYQHFYRATRHGAAQSGTHYIALGYEVETPEQAVVLDRTHSSCRWMTDTEILASPDVHEYAKDYFRPQRRTLHRAM